MQETFIAVYTQINLVVKASVNKFDLINMNGVTIAKDNNAYEIIHFWKDNIMAVQTNQTVTNTQVLANFKEKDVVQLQSRIGTPSKRLVRVNCKIVEIVF